MWQVPFPAYMGHSKATGQSKAGNKEASGGYILPDVGGCLPLTRLLVAVQHQKKPPVTGG